MNPDPPKREYDISEAPFEVSEQTPAQPGAGKDAQTEGDEEKRRQDGALASTFDPALAKGGKSDEEIDKQKHDAALAAAGAAVAAAVVVEHEINEHPHNAGPTTHHEAPPDHDALHDALHGEADSH